MRPAIPSEHALLATPTDLFGDDPLTLPPAWAPPPRPPVPLVASVVPVVGAVILWLVTGSVLSLWLAALGPLIAVATMLDASRGARRGRRRALREAAAVRARVAEAVAERHALERRRRRMRHPDVAGYLTRDDEVWRGATGRGHLLVIGEGECESGVRIAGGEGDPDAAALRGRAARLPDAAVVVPASEGVVVVGHPVLAAAVHRALVLQLCLALPPGELTLVGPLRGANAWAERLPHRTPDGGMRLALVGPGETTPADADVVLAQLAPGAPLPPRCGIVLAVESVHRARVERAGESVAVRVEAVAREQAESIATGLAARAERALGLARGGQPPVPLASLAPAQPRTGTLPAVVGLDGRDAAVIDLVSDGPHAVVAGVTGSGKSELLITWILALCAAHSTREVTFLLADFKGGTAFDSLVDVPHVTGVITDLDGAGARRAIESLRAEIRWREAGIAGAGARDILDPRVELPRLVVVVDEFAALLGDHPELHAVFSDVAARGRALGIHLVLGTQRAAGVIRESLLANCPLRVSLRVTDAADSRVVLGTDEAARLPGGAEGRGVALIRRASDAAPRRVRIALSGPDDLVVAAGRADGPEPRRPWLPALPSHIGLDELRARARQGDGPRPGGFVLALADEPERQRQHVVGVGVGDRGLLVIGGPGAGTSNALALVVAQAHTAVRIPSDAEGMWDAVAALAERPPEDGAVVVIDDIDALAGRLPPEYAQVLGERLEAVLRQAGDAGILVVASAHRLTGALSRLADLFPRRLLLGFPTRADHVAAGGEIPHFDADAPAGRGRLDGLSVQLAIAPRADVSPRHPPGEWNPSARLTGFVMRRSPAARAALGVWEQRGSRVVDVDAYAADPSVSADSRVVLVGEPDDWQRHWRLLADVRGDHHLVVDSSCAAELRLLTGSRALPPYCESGRGRAWLMAAGDEPVRIQLPSAHMRPLRRNGRS